MKVSTARMSGPAPATGRGAPAELE